MFGKLKSNEHLSSLPSPPNAEQILADLEQAGPDDVVFTTDISGAPDLDFVPSDFGLKKRFEVTEAKNKGRKEEDSELEETQEDLYEKVIAYNQNVEKLDTLSQKLGKKLQELQESKGELTEELLKVVQVHAEAVKLHQKVIQENKNAGDKA